MRHTRVCLFGTAAAAALAIGLPLAAEEEGDGPGLGAETVLSELDEPWDMAFLDDGTMFFTEKCNGLSVKLPDGEVNKLLGMEETEDYASTADDLFCLGQAGMMGVAVDPDFDDNRHIYVYSTSNMSDPHTNRVMRLTVNEDLTEVSDRTDIVEDIPYKMAESDHPFGGAGAHNGGRIRFGPDGYLYVTTGDNHLGEGPQSPTILAGKVLRIDRDGNAAEGNEAPEGFDERIFGYGFRNVQGIAFRPSDDAVFIAEHGPWHSDEITRLENGGNGGWDPRPGMAGREDCPDDYCGYSPNQMEGMDPEERAAYMPMTDLETYPDALPPAWNNNMLSQGTSSAVFLEGDQWGEWEGRMVVGIMGIGFGGTPVGQRIDVIDLTDDGLDVNEVIEMPLPDGVEPGRFRSVVLGPEGDLYASVVGRGIFASPLHLPVVGRPPLLWPQKNPRSGVTAPSLESGHDRVRRLLRITTTSATYAPPQISALGIRGHRVNTLRRGRIHRDARSAFVPNRMSAHARHVSGAARGIGETHFHGYSGRQSREEGCRQSLSS